MLKARDRASRLRALRGAHRISQKELGAEMGVHRSIVSVWEAGALTHARWMETREAIERIVRRREVAEGAP